MKEERKINWEVVKVVSLAAVIVFLCILGAVSCSPRVYPQTEIKDSTVVIRERVVHDTAFVEVEREVEKVVTRDTVSHLENKYGLSDAMVVDGFLYHSLETKPQIIQVPVAVPVVDTVVVTSEARTIVKEVNRLTWWQQTRLNLFWVLLSIVAGAAALLAMKIYLKIKR